MSFDKDVKRTIIILFSFIIFFTIPCFSVEDSQFQSSFVMQKGAILINADPVHPSSFYLLDTGISVPILKEKEGLEIKKPHNSDNIKLKDYEHNIPFVPYYQGKVILSDLLDISKKFGVHINGILPIFYPGYEIYLDFGKGKIVWQLITHKSKDQKKNIICEKMFFSSENVMPKISIMLNNKIASVANVDFVRNESVIFPMSMVNDKRLITNENTFAHFKGGKVVQYFRLKTLQVGSQKFNNLISVSVPEEKEISLGTSFWRQFVLKINYEEASICFLKTNISDEREWAGVGILPDCLNEEGWLIGVIENSSAWSYNLRGGETLIKIDECEIKSLDIDQIIRLLNPPQGTEITCKVIDFTRKIRELKLKSQRII